MKICLIILRLETEVGEGTWVEDNGEHERLRERKRGHFLKDRGVSVYGTSKMKPQENKGISHFTEADIIPHFTLYPPSEFCNFMPK